jgi:hypothetical protein
VLINATVVSVKHRKTKLPAFVISHPANVAPTRPPTPILGIRFPHVTLSCTHCFAAKPVGVLAREVASPNVRTLKKQRRGHPWRLRSLRNVGLERTNVLLQPSSTFLELQAERVRHSSWPIFPRLLFKIRP